MLSHVVSLVSTPMTKLWKLKTSAKIRAEQLRKRLEKGGKLSSMHRPAWWLLLHRTQKKARAAAGKWVRRFGQAGGIVLQSIWVRGAKAKGGMVCLEVASCMVTVMLNF